MAYSNKSSRRNFLKQASYLGAAATAAPSLLQALPTAASGAEGTNCTFLFQGDSITDGNRTRNMDWNHVLGHGYAYLIAARLWYELPKKSFHFFNRGISGNKVTDLTKRWQDDTIALKPDVLSILIGVNDVSAAINGDESFTASSYERDYRDLLTQTKQQLPSVQLVICEPFILPAGRVKERLDVYQNEILARQQTAKTLAVEFDAIFVPLQDSFNKEAEKNAPAEYWIWDGIHPMPNGHELIAKEWIKHVSKKLKFIKY